MNIGSALRDIRQNVAKRRQNEVAQSIGISQTYLSQVEGGKKVPHQEVVEKLCKEYKVPIAIVVWQGLETKDVDKSKKKAFEMIKPIVDDLVAGFLVNNF
jgi:transcriptional regulator with XRE-family HTH domain